LALQLQAQAIMLLAGSGNPWSSSYMNPPGNVGSGRPFSTPMAVPQSTTSRPGSPAPQATTSAAAAPVNLILASQRIAKTQPVTHVGEYLGLLEPLQFLDNFFIGSLLLVTVLVLKIALSVSKLLIMTWAFYM
jgi:hypothetical protein